jgi:dTDP-4-dehydrorhamnose reductase
MYWCIDERCLNHSKSGNTKKESPLVWNRPPVSKCSTFLPLQPRVVINCAAVSVPRECELDPEKAMATNIPSALLQWLSSLNAAYPPLLIHLSTDQGERIENYSLIDSKSSPFQFLF